MRGLSKKNDGVFLDLLMIFYGWEITIKPPYARIVVYFSEHLKQIQVFVGGVNWNGITYQGLRWDSYSFCLSFVRVSFGFIHLPVSVLLSFRTDQGVSWMNFFWCLSQWV